MPGQSKPGKNELAPFFGRFPLPHLQGALKDAGRTPVADPGAVARL
jgi:hypothetical protein